MSIIASLIAAKAAGELKGLLASKTQYGVSAVAGAGIWAILPRALEQDPEAIGQLVLMAAGWLIAMFGRLGAKPDQPRKPKRK